MEQQKKKDSESAVKADKYANNAEGISKAEARTRRKEAKKQNKGKKDTTVSAVTLETNNLLKTEKKEINRNDLIKAKKVLSADLKKSIETNLHSSTDVTKVGIKCDKNVSTLETLPNNEQSGKGEMSKAELRAKRRAIQEAQRLAKEDAKTTGKSQILETKSMDLKKVTKNDEKTHNNVMSKNIENYKYKTETRVSRKSLQNSPTSPGTDKLKTHTLNDRSRDRREKIKRYNTRKDSISVVTGRNFDKQVQLFNHLYLHHNASLIKNPVGLHSSIVRLGAQYMSHKILGSNARCLALLSAVKSLITDYRTPSQQEFCRSLESKLQDSMNYLQKCRPLAVSMTNAIRNIKWQLTQISTNLSDGDKRNKILEGIDTYIKDEIGTADKAISMKVKEKICNGDIILTYGCSSLVLKILLDAHENKKKFKVVVVDARPLLEGREMLRKLVNAKLSCSYVLINAASFIMGKVTKVLLGAHSLLANGYVMSRAGTAQVALIAQSFNKPVLVCCETYKFCERVQTDSIVHNEIGDPDKLIAVDTYEGKCPLADWKNIKHVTPLNLMYDVTPPDFVTAVVTELAILPCTSVPVILRIKPTELAL